MIKNVFQTIKSHVAILDVISTYTSLKKAGHYFKGHCPFHSEKTASFTVSPDKGIFYCFGCHEGGDVIAFIAKIERCSQLEAAQLLAQRLDIEIEAETTYQRNGTSPFNNKKRYTQICKYIAHWYKKKLEKNQAAQQYLESRSIGSKAIECFTLGYAPSGTRTIHELIAHAQKAQFLLEDILSTGFIQKNRSGLFCPYEERILFPIKDAVGSFCGFGGRVFKSGDNRPKYYNTPENDHFIKSKLLFGLDLARQEIQKTETVFLVEGYTDCISMVNNGYLNTVAILGTACTQEHLEALSRYAKHVYVLYDSDSAGIKACLKLAQVCWQVSLDLYICQLPPGSDPANYLEEHRSIKIIIDQARDIFAFYLLKQSEDFHSLPLGDKMHRLRTALQVISTVPDKLKQTMLINKASASFGIEQSVIKEECARLKKQLNQPKSPMLTTNPNPCVNTSKPENKQEDLVQNLALRALFGILHDVALYDDADRRIVEYFLDEKHRLYLNLLGRSIANSGTKGAFQIVYNALESHDQRALSQGMLQNEPLSRHQFSSLLFQIEKIYFKRRIASLKQQLGQIPENNKQATQDVLQKIISLGKRLTKKSTDTDGVGV